jgi:N-acetylglucosamine-6-phosphate deacetylase
MGFAVRSEAIPAADQEIASPQTTGLAMTVVPSLRAERRMGFAVRSEAIPAADQEIASPQTTGLAMTEREIASPQTTGLAMTGQACARVLGAHLESPYVSPAQKGALDPAAMRTPDDGSVDALLDYADVLRIFVLAPELPGALDLVRRLAARGIVPAVGHSSAKDEQVAAAMRAGLRHVTHIWSSMSSVVREGPWRKPGVLESALVFDGLHVEMIADNRHLPATLMKLAYKCIGPNRLSIVSDATNGAGLPAGTRYRMGAMEYVVGDGVGMMLDGTAFAGSTTLLNQMIPVLRDVVGVPLVEAIRMATLNPARAIGLDAILGSIAPGKRADLTVFEDDFRAWRVMIEGWWANE